MFTFCKPNVDYPSYIRVGNIMMPSYVAGVATAPQWGLGGQVAGVLWLPWLHLESRINLITFVTDIQCIMQT